MTASKTAVITGANRGIGLELARQFAGQGYSVFGVCRESSDELNAIATSVIDGIDVPAKPMSARWSAS
jgi:NAD(P)-dependent dehydrogenase (short-subunit alcohol dehydrogenase family)